MNNAITTYEELPVDEQQKWARSVDFLSPLPYQAMFRGDVEIFYFSGHMSVPSDISIPDKVYKNDLLEIEQSTTARNRYDITAGAPNPYDRTGAKFDTAPIREIYENIYDEMGIKWVSTTEIGIMHTLSETQKRLGEIQSLDGVEQVAEMKEARGNRENSFKKMTLVDVTNHHDLRKNQLIRMGAVTEDEANELHKHARSSLVSNWLLTDTGMRQHEFTSNADLMRTLAEFQRDQPLQDIARPVELNVGDQAGRMYRLVKNNGLTAL